MNNVDLRQGMPWGAGLADIAAVSDKGDNAIRVYRVADEGRALELLGSQPLGEALDVDGICLYRRAADGELYAFVTDMAGPLEQWRLRPDGAGGVAFERVRAWSTGHAMEACVVDDEADRLFVSAEEHGVLVFDADPAAPTDEPLLLDAVGPGGNLSLDVEGLALYREAAGDGYLVVSSQGSDDFVVYDRQPPHALRGRFRVVHQDEDAVTHTDGIEVTSAPLGAPFERGLFVAQDDVNHDGNQNFKLVPWSSVADAVGLDPER